MQRLVMVGTEKGAFFLRSDAAGASWNVEGPMMRGWKVSDIALDRRSEPAFYAAVGSWVYGATIQVSRDWGATWPQVEHGPAYAADARSTLKSIWTIVPGRATEPGVLYAGVDEAGLFVSRDAGEHWEEIPGVANHPTRDEWMGGLGGLCCHTILLHPTNPQRMWVGISAVGVLRTDDGGQTWQTKNTGLTMAIEGKVHKDVGTCVHRMVLDPADPDRLYQQNHMGVMRSADAGDTWERIENGLVTDFGFPMVIHPHDPKTLFIVPEESGEFRMPVGGQLTVYRTRDRGDNWEPLRDGLPGDCYAGVMRQAMAMDDSPEGGVYFGTTAGQLFTSIDNGGHWKALPYTFPRILSVNAVCLE